MTQTWSAAQPLRDGVSVSLLPLSHQNLHLTADKNSMRSRIEGLGADPGEAGMAFSFLSHVN